MTDESGPAEGGRSMTGQATPTPSQPPDHAELDSRVEIPLWRLLRGSDRAEARLCVKFGRRDFRVYVNGELLWSRNYAFDETARFDADAAAKRDEFIGQGWDLP
jgi:hypothetical protein